MRAHGKTPMPPRVEYAGSAPVHPPLMTSKLDVPSGPSELVSRRRLHDLLDERRLVTLLSAPAGWGKTVLLASWARSRAEDERVAWLAMEPGDDAARLRPYLLAALGSTGAGDGRIDGRSWRDQHLAGALASLCRPVVLVLDDFQHVVDPQFHHDVEFLVRHSAGRVRLVVLTRVDPPLPLPRWRVAGDLIEVGCDRLAFTTDETASLLAAYGQAVPHSTVSELHDRTEGWPAILTLAALAGGDHVDSLAAPAGLLASTPTIREYLRREVLLDQPRELQALLVQTSVLEQVNGGLLDALTGRADGEQVLQELQHQNLFASAGAARPWSGRYHRVLAEVLRHELSRRATDNPAVLHRHAAHWYATNGLLWQALGHALAGGDWGHASTMVAEHWHRFILCRRAHQPPVSCQAPPDDAVRADPYLALGCAAHHLEAGDLRLAVHYLGLADQAKGGPATAHAAWAVAMAWMSDDGQTVVGDAQRLLAAADQDDVGPVPRDGVRVIGRTILGTTLLGQGDLGAAERILLDTLAPAEDLGLTCAQALCASGLSFVAAARGRLRAAERMARAALALSPCPGQTARVHCGFAYLALAMVDLERNCLHDADANLKLAANVCQSTGDPALAAMIAVVRAQARHECGDTVHAYEALMLGRRDLARRMSPFLRDWYTAVETRIRTRHGDADAVRESITSTSDGGSNVPPAVAVALAQAYLDVDNSVAACQSLPNWTDTEDRSAPTLRLEAGLVEAVVAYRRGDRGGATRKLEQVLAAAEPEGFRQVFVRSGPTMRDLLSSHLDSGTAYWCTVNDLVGAMDGGSTHEAAGVSLTEPLTDREVTVLRYLQGAFSNAEIASDLSVSVNTVKTHVRNIYRKLDAAGRREAVRLARQLHLI